MSTISQQMPNFYNIKSYGKKFSLRSVCYPQDMNLLYQWMHAEHVVEQWQLHLPMKQLKWHFEKALADDHQRLYIISCEDQPIGYTEIYEASRDRLSQYYKAKSTDMGWHVLLGNTDVVGRGYLRPTGMLITDFIFQNTPAQKVVGEPDSTVEVYKWVADSFGYHAQRIISMPEKSATLYFCHRDEFYNSRGYKSCYNSNGKVLLNTDANQSMVFSNANLFGSE